MGSFTLCALRLFFASNGSASGNYWLPMFCTALAPPIQVCLEDTAMCSYVCYHKQRACVKDTQVSYGGKGLFSMVRVCLCPMSELFQMILLYIYFLEDQKCYSRENLITCFYTLLSYFSKEFNKRTVLLVLAQY